MKKFGAVVLSVFIGIVVLSVLSAIFEATSFYLGGLSSFLALLAGIFAGMKTYSHTAPADNTTEQNESTNMPLYALFTLLILQLPFAFGYANEFEDHFFSLAAAVLFFFAELWFLFKVTQKRGVTILISILLFLSVLMTFAFINGGTDIISNKYPADVYHSTYWWVIAILAGQALLEALKLIILHRDKV